MAITANFYTINERLLFDTWSLTGHWYHQCAGTIHVVRGENIAPVDHAHDLGGHLKVIGRVGDLILVWARPLCLITM